MKRNTEAIRYIVGCVRSNKDLLKYGETVEETDGNGEGQLHGSSSLVLPEVESLTGDLLYIDNRAAVTRASDQTEDIKIVIQL